ncbi:MAG: hypothetical protein HC841_02235 [Verrucomicrobiae bacterium]|nr:hypothetical protein [Verrucomicrobiae bacterium]
MPDSSSGISIIGAGAWGCALALSHARAGRRVRLWARSEAVVDEINTVSQAQIQPLLAQLPPMKKPGSGSGGAASMSMSDPVQDAFDAAAASLIASLRFSSRLSVRQVISIPIAGLPVSLPTSLPTSLCR